eukprot:8474866-Ditylum_brightwellii.AAC.1
MASPNNMINSLEEWTQHIIAEDSAEDTRTVEVAANHLLLLAATMKQKAFNCLVELVEEKAKVARKKKGLHCKLCDGSLKNDVEVCVDCLEEMCKKCIVGCYVCKEL